MANCKTVFLGTENSSTDHCELQCYVNEFNQIYIEIKDVNLDDPYNVQWICLDKSTAIKFAKTLRTEINKIQS